MKKRPTKENKGSALLLTLGILSMVLVLGMAFSFTSRTNRKLALVKSDNVKASLVVDSAQNLVLAVLKNNGENKPFLASSWNTDDKYPILFDTSIPQHYWTSGEDTDDIEKEQQKVQLFSNWDNNDYFNSLYDSLWDDENTIPKWNSIFDEDKIIGRYAFYVFDDTAKLDLNAILTLSQDCYNMPFIKGDDARLSTPQDTNTIPQPWYVFDVFGRGEFEKPINYTVKKNSLQFLGLTMRELKIDDSYFSGLSAEGSGKYLPPWLSYQHLMTNSNFTGDGKYWYTFFSGETPESYYYQKDNEEKEYARFDLSGYEWTQSQTDYYNEQDGQYNPQSIGSWQKGTDKSPDSDYARKLVNALTSAQNRPTFWKNNSELSESSESTPQKWYANKDIQAVRKASLTKSVPKYNDSSFGVDFGIPWLYCANQTDDTTSAPDTTSTTLQKKQIAANLVDYCDSDSFATYDTADDDKNLSLTNLPLYFGNELTPCINEIYFQSEVVCKNTGTNENKQYTYSFTVKPTFEFMNPFDKETPEVEFTANVTLSYRFLFNEPVDGVYTDNEKQEIEKWHERESFSCAGKCEALSSGYYYFYCGTSKSFDSGEIKCRPVEEGKEDKAFNFRVQVRLMSVQMHTGSENKYGDFMAWKCNTYGDDSPESKEGVPNLILDTKNEWNAASLGTDPYHSSLEARDPEYNYDFNLVEEKDDHDLWQMMTFDGATYVACPPKSESPEEFKKTKITIEVENGKKNDDKYKNTIHYYKDEEAGKTIDKKASATIACSKIANRPIQTLDELGLIHRGEIGCTLNLLKYNQDATPNGFGIYKDGDANILDQVKIGPAKFTKGLFNANSINTLSKISGIESEAKDTTLSLLCGDTMNFKISATTKPEKNYVFSRAATLLDALENNWKEDDKYDTTKECIPARMCGLLSTRYEAFTIFLIGQSLDHIGASNASDGINEQKFDTIKDLFTNPITCKVGTENTKDYYCNISSTKARMVQVLRDTWCNSFQVIQVKNLE